MSEPIVLRAKPLDASARFPTRDGRLRHFDSLGDWHAAAERLFGDERRCWAFTCHHCHTTYSAADGALAGMPVEKIGFSCIGPYDPRVGCTYNGANKLPPNPVTVTIHGQTARMLAFAGD